MTSAANQFIDGIATAWDHRDCYTQTAASGLSETDAAALRSLCDTTGEEYETAEREVMEFVRAKVA